jgi:hypothetical protein
MEPVPETLYLNQLTWLIAREDYIESCCRESFKTYSPDLTPPVIFPSCKVKTYLKRKMISACQGAEKGNH